MYPLHRGDDFYPMSSKFDDILLLRKFYLFRTEINLYRMDISIRLSWPVFLNECHLATSRRCSDVSEEPPASIFRLFKFGSGVC